jgi:outer membrane biosynthesis protein TonB
VSVDLSPTLDLHRRILSELELREAATREQETEARRALDSALQNIAAERRAIKQCRDLLTQAATLYKSFVGSDRATTKTDVPQPIEAPVAAADPELAPAQSSAGDEPAPRVTDAPSPYAEAPQPTEAPVAAPAPAPAVAEPLPWATEAPAPHVNDPQPTEVSVAAREQASEPEVTGEELSTLAAEEPAPDTTPLPGTSIEAESFARVENLRSEITAESGRGGGGSWWAGMWRRGTRDEEVELSWKEAYPPVEGAERAIWDHNHPNRTQE